MIAVTGANGLLGSFVVRKLLDQNENFIALKRANSDVSLLRDKAAHIKWQDADILDAVSLETALKGVTKVIHTAAVVSFNPRLKNHIYNVNVCGTRNVVNACLHNGVNKFIHISSVAALGRLKEQTTIDEQNKWTDSAINSTYAQTKYLSELEVFRATEEGLNSVIINPSIILAAADWFKSSAKLFRYVWDERPFYVDSQLNYVDVRDVADLAVKMLKVNRPGERFILNAGTVELKEFLSKTADRFGKKVPRIKLNTTLLKLVALAERYRSWVVGAEPLITAETARLVNTRFMYKNDKVKNEFNFEFTTFDKTLDWCCQYYIAQQNAKK
jgi:dihydroflavonol-4-reductase